LARDAPGCRNANRLCICAFSDFDGASFGAGLKCHGETRLGNGELAKDLTPSPALLAYLVQQPIAVDQYLLWTI
jgi:hypothetical protein